MSVRRDGDRWRCIAHHWSTVLKLDLYDGLVESHASISAGALFEVGQVLHGGTAFILLPLSGHSRKQFPLVAARDLGSLFAYDYGNEAKPSMGAAPRKTWLPATNHNGPH